MTTRLWLCKCGTRNERIKQRCVECRGPRPKKRVPAHARTLRDDSYAVYREVNAELHAGAFDGDWTPDDCGVCGKKPATTRHMDRDHDHRTGKPRGLACPGNTGCNALMPKQLDLYRARLIVAYLERVEARDLELLNYSDEQALREALGDEAGGGGGVTENERSRQ